MGLTRLRHLYPCGKSRGPNLGYDERIGHVPTSENAASSAHAGQPALLLSDRLDTYFQHANIPITRKTTLDAT